MVLRDPRGKLESQKVDLAKGGSSLVEADLGLIAVPGGANSP